MRKGDVMLGPRFGRGARSAVSFAAMLLVMFGMMVGCEKPPPVEPKTPQEQAQELIDKAGVIVEKVDVTEEELREAAEILNRAVELFSEAEVDAVREKISAKLDEFAEAAKVKQLLVDIGVAIGDKNYKEAIRLADQALAADPGNAEAERLKADAEQALAAVPTPREDPREKYAALKAEFDRAKGARNYGRAKELIREIEKYVALGGGPSLKLELPKLEAAQLVDEAKPLVNRRDVRTLDRAIEKLKEAKRKDPGNRDAPRLLSRAEANKKRIVDTEAGKRQYNDTMNRAKRYAGSPRISELQLALREYEKAKGIAPSASDRQRALRGAEDVRKTILFIGKLSRGEQLLSAGRPIEAKKVLKEASRIKTTRKLEDLLRKAEGQVAKAEGDTAASAGKWAEAVAALQKAKALGVNVDTELANALKMKTAQEGDVLMASFTQQRKEGKFMEIRAGLEAFIEATGREDAKKLLAQGPTAAEVKKLDAGALKAYKDVLAAAKKVEPGRATEKIAVYVGALPKVAGTRYEKLINSLIAKEKDGIFRGQFTKFRQAWAKKKTSDLKIAYGEGELPRFKGTSYAKTIEGMISGEKTRRAAGEYGKLRAAVAKIKPADQKIARLEAALETPVFQGTTYIKSIKGMISGEKNKRAAGAWRKVSTDAKKAKTPAGKIAVYQGAAGDQVFKGTRYTKMIADAVKREKDNLARPEYTKVVQAVKKLKKHDEKIAKLEGAVRSPVFEGTSLKGLLEGMIKREKDAKKRSEFTAVRTKKLKTNDEKISWYTDQLPNFKGTTYEKQIRSMIDAARNAKMAKAFADLRARVGKFRTPQPKILELERMLPMFKGTRYYKQIEGMIKKEKDLIASKNYAAFNKDVAKVAKDPNEEIRRLERGKAEFAGTRYEKIIGTRLKKAKSAIKSKLYSKLMGDVKKLKTSAEKVQLLKSQLGEFQGTSYEKGIKAQIKTYESKIKAEEQAAKDAKAKKVYDAVMAKIKKTAKDYDGNITKLQEAKLNVFGSSRYVTLLDNLIKTQRKLKARSQPKPPR